MSKHYKAHKKFSWDEQKRLDARREKTLEAQQTAKALFLTWLPLEKDHPDYVKRLRNKVYRLDKQVTNMGLGTI